MWNVFIKLATTAGQYTRYGYTETRVRMFLLDRNRISKSGKEKQQKKKKKKSNKNRWTMQYDVENNIVKFLWLFCFLFFSVFFCVCRISLGIKNGRKFRWRRWKKKEKLLERMVFKNTKKWPHTHAHTDTLKSIRIGTRKGCSIVFVLHSFPLWWHDVKKYGRKEGNKIWGIGECFCVVVCL